MSKITIYPLIVLLMLSSAIYPLYAQDNADIQVYFVDNTEGVLKRFNLATPGLSANLTSGLIAPVDLAIDRVGGYVYITVEGGIERVTLDGREQTSLIMEQMRLCAVSLDTERGHIYWTDFTAGTINRSNLDGSNITPISNGLAEPCGLALDPAAGKMYFTEVGEIDRINRANLDGSAVETFINIGGLQQPGDIVLDVAGGKMY